MRDEQEKAKAKRTPRPRFKRRTWGTLRVVLIRECAKASSFEGSLKDSGLVVRATRQISYRTRLRRSQREVVSLWRCKPPGTGVHFFPQQDTQFFVRAVKLGFGSSHRAFHHLRDLGVLVSLHVVQFEDQLVAGGQLCDRVLQADPVDSAIE